MRIVGILITATLLAGAASLALLPRAALPKPPAPEAGVPELASRILTAPPGAIVDAVFTHPGDRVRAGQVILRLRPTELDRRIQRVRSGLLASPPQSVATAANLVSRISPNAWHRLIASDPQLLAAEQGYVDAALAAERSPSPEATARLRNAIAHRLAVQQLLGRIRPSGAPDFSTLYAQTTADIAWLAGRSAASEVRAPIEGVVEIFDLSPGSEIDALGRVALLKPLP